MLADVYEAHSILSKNVLLDFFFKFFKDLVDNDSIYGIQFQRKINESFSTLQNKERLTQKKMHVLVFMFLQYVQIMMRILECLTRTLPQTNLAGMALGLEVTTTNPHFTYEWIIKRLNVVQAYHSS